MTRTTSIEEREKKLQLVLKELTNPANGNCTVGFLYKRRCQMCRRLLAVLLLIERQLPCGLSRTSLDGLSKGIPIKSKPK